MKTRMEHDLLGEKEVPAEAYYGIQTLRGIENFANISGITIGDYPNYVKALAMVKWAAAKANLELGLLPEDIAKAITEACEEIIDGRFHDQFPVDLVQGGAGTSTNMNINEVVANRALEILGHKKGEYQYCHPNNHVNLSQSTNDAFPTSFKLAFIFMNEELVAELRLMIQAFRKKGEEFKDILKMGRTQLQDAVPMTLGQEFEAFAANLEEEIDRLNQMAKLFLEVNMGATAIGTGINSEPEYSQKCIKNLRIISGHEFVLASNLIEATPDTGSTVMYSSALKRMAVKLSKICNDLRLLSSGPRCGLNEINLPPMQPGSSIMPGKVNPVIPEVVNQICYRIIGNDLTVTFAAEAGQLQLNVMEPIIVHALFGSIKMLQKGMERLRVLCVDGITANADRCREMVLNSIGIVTALNPTLGYENSSRIAKRALKENRSVYDLVLEEKLLTKEELDELLKPELWEETALADFKNGGRSYGMITSIWQLRGEAKAMEYAASFNSQLPLYTASEWEAIEAVRSGRKTIAVVSLSTALQLERQNRDLFATLVKDGNKNCITGAAILQGANLAEAQSFMDYLLSEHSKDLLASKGYPLLWRVSDYAHDDGRKMMIGDLELAVDDLSWTAGQKSVIIQQWLNAQ